MYTLQGFAHAADTPRMLLPRSSAGRCYSHLDSGLQGGFVRHAWRPLRGLKSHQAGGISLGTDSDAEHCPGRCKMPNTPRFRPPGWVCETHLGAPGRAQKPIRPGGLASAMTVRAGRCERLNTTGFWPPVGVCETHLGVLQEAPKTHQGRVDLPLE